jgi:RNA polymerase sigma-70 factor (ECF subfamily)
MPTTTTSDFELLDAWREGDRSAGSELFGRYFGPVYGFFRSKLEHAAEDLTQQTFLNCVEARDDFRGAGSFRTYLFVVARNVLFGHLRRRANRDVDLDFEVTSIADLDASPSTMLGFREDHKLLVHALRRLPVDLQVALELYYVQRMRAPALATILGIPPGTVRSRIRRAIEQLRLGMCDLAASPQRIRTTLTDLNRWAAELRDTPRPARAGAHR